MGSSIWFRPWNRARKPKVLPVELALPHVVVRVCGPDVGPDLVAALSVHPVEVSEARDAWEMKRVSEARPALLVVVVDPPDAHRVVAETWGDFPGVPILVVSDSTTPYAPGHGTRSGWVDTVPSSQPMQDLCWQVLEAVGRAARVPGIAERPLGLHLIEVDARGIVSAGPTDFDLAMDAGFQLRPGDSLLAIVEPLDRTAIAGALERAGVVSSQFRTTRLLDDHGCRHIVDLGMRSVGDGRIAVIVQPLISGASIVGRHVNNRDPITGLLTR